MLSSVRPLYIFLLAFISYVSPDNANCQQDTPNDRQDATNGRQDAPNGQQDAPNDQQDDTNGRQGFPSPRTYGYFAPVSPANPENEAVRKALMYAVQDIHMNDSVRNYYGPFEATFSRPFNVQATKQEVGGMLYRYTFEITSRPKCENQREHVDCENFRKYHTGQFGNPITVPRMYVCSASVWDRPWLGSERYTLMRRPDCVQIVG